MSGPSVKTSLTLLACGLLLMAAQGCRRPRPTPMPPAATARAAASRPAPTTATAPATMATRHHAPLTWCDRVKRLAARPGKLRLGPRLRDSFLAAARELVNDGRAQMAAADRAMARGDIATAVICYRRAVALAPRDADALKGVAMALMASRKFDDALPVFRQLLEIDSQDKVTRFNLAVALAQLRQFGQAETAYLELLRIDPAYYRARYNLATLYRAQGKLESARNAWAKVLEQAAELAPADRAWAYAAYGEVLMDLRDFPAAMEATAQAAKLQSDDPDAWLNFAAASTAAQSYGRALVAARRAAKLAGLNATTWARCGDILLELHRATGKPECLAEALEDWRISLGLDGNQPKLRADLQTYEPLLKSIAATRPSTNPN